MFGSCPSKLDGEMLPFRFKFCNNTPHGMPAFSEFFSYFTTEIFEFSLNQFAKFDGQGVFSVSINQDFVHEQQIFPTQKSVSSIFPHFFSCGVHIFEEFYPILPGIY